MSKNIYSNLKGRTAFISGGKRIGQTVAKVLAENGVNIIASYRSSSEEAEEIVKNAKKLKVKALSVQCDVSQKESVEKALKEIKKSFKQIDILINMASVFTPVSLENVTEKDWSGNFNAHVLGTFWPAQVFGKIIPRGGHIINIADRTSLGKSYKGYLPYIVTKAAVSQMTKTLATELGPKGIFVNAIAPGPILRPPDLSPKEWKGIRDASPLKFPIDDTEAVNQFAMLVVYLSSVTMASGYTYPLDQGQNL